MAEQIDQHIRAAGQAYQLGNFKLAINRCDALLQRYGPRSDVLTLKAMSLLKLDKPEMAANLLAKAIKLEPNRAEIRLNTALVFENMHHYRQARKSALEAVRLARGNARLMQQAARICRIADDREMAIRLLDRCVQLEPGLSDAWHLKGVIHLDLGDKESARRALEQTIEIKPDHIKALALLGPLVEDGDTAIRIQQSLENIRYSQASAAIRSSAAFALGNSHRRAGQNDAAFDEFDAGNQLAVEAKPMDHQAWQRALDHTLGSALRYSSPELPTGQGPGIAFIVGMPRSGTSLLEQSLSAHDDILGSGENHGVQYLEASLARQGINSTTQIREFDERQRQEVAERYYAALPQGWEQYRWTTDKTPLNFLRVDLIDCLLPGARFIHCTRHPLDIILSCYFNEFSTDLAWSFDQVNIARLYVTSMRLMEAWKKALPDRVFEVNYEEMVADLPAMARSLARFLDIEHQDAMDQPHKVERAVFTASLMQVRQPVYSSSVGRWEKYRHRLQPAIEYLQAEGIQI